MAMLQQLFQKMHPPAIKIMLAEALNFLTKTSPAFGGSKDKPPEFVVDPIPESTSSNATAVYAKQTLYGIRLFQSGADGKV